MQREQSAEDATCNLRHSQVSSSMSAISDDTFENLLKAQVTVNGGQFRDVKFIL
jgi:hypothetical protein